MFAPDWKQSCSKFNSSLSTPFDSIIPCPFNKPIKLYSWFQRVFLNNNVQSSHIPNVSLTIYPSSRCDGPPKLKLLRENLSHHIFVIRRNCFKTESTRKLRNFKFRGQKPYQNNLKNMHIAFFFTFSKG